MRVSFSFSELHFYRIPQSSCNDIMDVGNIYFLLIWLLLFSYDIFIYCFMWIMYLFQSNFLELDYFGKANYILEKKKFPAPYWNLEPSYLSAKMLFSSSVLKYLWYFHCSIRHQNCSRYSTILQIFNSF